MNHTQLLNYLISKHNLKSYLEIGVQSTVQNFDKIKCAYKVGVDPQVSNGVVLKITSDIFFQILSTTPLNKQYGLVFIDGLHHSDQIKRDFDNSLACLNDKGFIVIHDTMPDKEETTHVPRDSKVWHGDVYKFILNLHTYDGIDFYTYPYDCGCTVVWKDPTKKGSGEPVKTDWENYLSNKHLFRIKEAVE